MEACSVYFDSPIGLCGLRWQGDALQGIWLPDSPLDGFAAFDEAAAPPFVVRAVQGIRSVLSGADDDLLDVPLAFGRAALFEQRVWAATRQIRSGHTRTYGELADALEMHGAARDVGQALGRNPFPIVVPCHRVLAAGGKTGGFSARGGVELKLRLLAIEGAAVGGTRLLF